MQLLLSLLFTLSTLAAPLPVAPNNASHFPDGGSPPSGDQYGSQVSAKPRHWNVLYPRPGSQTESQPPWRNQPNASVPAVQLTSSITPLSITKILSNSQDNADLALKSIPSKDLRISVSPKASTTSDLDAVSLQNAALTSAVPSFASQLSSNNSRASGDQQDGAFAQSPTLRTAPPSSQSFANFSASSGLTRPTPGIAASTSASVSTNLTTNLAPSSRPSTIPGVVPPGEAPLHLSLVNNLNSAKANAYISALDSNGRVVMINGAGFYYLPDVSGSSAPQPLPADIAIPLPATGTLQIMIPGFVEGARVWFADGTLDFSVVSTVNGPALVEPTAVNQEDGSVNTNWGFVELTWSATYGLFANLSFVDFLGLPLALDMVTSFGRTQVVPGVPRDAVEQVCKRLQSSSGIEFSWANLCVYDTSGVAIRVISPAVLLSRQPDAFPSFFQRYVERVWQRYAFVPLMIDTQTSSGLVTCRTAGDEIQCDGDNRGYAKPSAIDIFGCDSGPFSILETDNAIHRAVVPRLCAAFDRATLLLEGGEVQPSLPPSSYYTQWPHNLYSAVIHDIELDGRGYAFSYDDVTPSVADGVAGILTAPHPQVLTVFVGGR